jgi:predicted RNA-binding Zn-ribbon protein involved in translation (DUF1610 family)
VTYPDNTFVLELYGGDIESPDYSEQMAGLAKTLMKTVYKELSETSYSYAIRANRFSIVKCPDCGTYILTNRDIDEPYTCLKCKSTGNAVLPLKKVEKLIEGFEKTVSIVCKPLLNHRIFVMTCHIPKKRNHELDAMMIKHGYEKFSASTTMYFAMANKLSKTEHASDLKENPPKLYARYADDSECAINTLIRSIQKLSVELTESIAKDAQFLYMPFDMDSKSYYTCLKKMQL